MLSPRLKTLFRVVPLTFILFSASQAFGAPVFSQSPPATTGGYKSDFTFNFVNQQAQRFSLASDTSIQAVVAWGAYGSGLPTDNFTIRIFADDGGGSPEVLPLIELSGVAAVRVDTGGLKLGTNPIYQYTFNLAAPIALLGSTDYYLSVVNSTNLAESWSWVEGATTNDLRWSREADGNAWFAPQPANLAFELHDAPIVIPPTTPTTPAQPVPVMPVGLLLGLILGFIAIARVFAIRGQ